VAGCVVLGQAGTREQGSALVRAGCDAVIAQGIEAGGHVQGEVGLLALVGELSRELSVPVIAAGGLADARGVRAVLAAGAAGAAMGTRFLATPEADVHPRYVARVLEAGADDTVLTGLFDGGWPDAPHRVLRNTTHAAWERAGCPQPGSRPGEGEPVAELDGVTIARYAADEPRRSATGDIEAMCLYAGQGVGLVTQVVPAQEIVSRIGFEL
jgi:nitronate monooxygenase